MTERKTLISVRMAVWGSQDDLRRVIGGSESVGDLDGIDTAASALGLAGGADG